jgi:hypothetical protein
VAAAAETALKAMERGGTAMFRVHRDLSEGRFTRVAAGTLRVGPSGISFEADDGSQRITAPWREVRDTGKGTGTGPQTLDEVVQEMQKTGEKLADELGKFFGARRRPQPRQERTDGDRSAFFVVLAQGGTHVFAPTSRHREEERRLILVLAERAASKRSD